MLMLDRPQVNEVICISIIFFFFFFFFFFFYTAIHVGRSDGKLTSKYLGAGARKRRSG
jgi:hypothetical protein